MTAGYYRFPTIHDDTVVFVSEDDLWSVPRTGGVARRLTSNLGDVSYPMLSPDGTQLAFVGKEEGAAEVYVMRAEGGSARRLTYLSSNCRVVGWTADGAIIFTSNYGQPTWAEMHLYSVQADAANGEVTHLDYGAARSIAFGPQGGVVIGRNTGDPARWKRYRGGTAGQVWVDAAGNGEFARLLPNLAGNLASPMWLPVWLDGGGAGRIYFVSDHEGVGNLYSCRADGSDLQRHTDHADYYVRNPTADGRRIVYHAGADLFVYTPATDEDARVDVGYHSPRVQRNRKFVQAARYVDGYHLHPNGHVIALTTRGKAYTFFSHEGPVVQVGKRDGVRYRKPVWLRDGRFVLVSDNPGEETLEVYTGQPQQPPKRLNGLDIGRVVDLRASPTDQRVALANHRHELLLVDLDAGAVTVVDRSSYRNISGFDWSPDGRWLAYSYAATSRLTEIRLFRLPQPADAQPAEPAKETPADAAATLAPTAAGERFTITRPVLHDVSPAFDPDGKYLYFLSYREFNPVYDGLHFDLAFPWGMRPYLITLRRDLPNPFIPVPDLSDGEKRDDQEDGDADDDRDDEDAGDDDGAPDEGGEEDEPGDDLDDGDLDDDDAGDETGDGEEDSNVGARRLAAETAAANAPAAKDKPARDHQEDKGKGHKVKPVRIDLDGIEQRVIAFPVQDAKYGQIMGVRNKALFTVFPIHGTLDGDYNWQEEEPEAATLRAYDFKEYKTDDLAENVISFDLSANRKKLIYAARGQLRVIAAGEKAPHGSGNSRKTGWIDLNRIKVSVEPQSEWEQMFREAWRLQRDQFWTQDMSEVDWQTVYQRYFQLIERVSTRGEFSDLLWEMQGELGTSHAYEFGGDYRPRPYYGQGYLGAELHWDAEAGGYRVGDLVLGDAWDTNKTSPLTAPGVNIKSGDMLVAVNGQRLDATTGPAQLLVNQAGHEVLLTLLAPPKAAAEKPAQESTAPDADAPATTETPPDATDAATDAAANGKPPTSPVALAPVEPVDDRRYRHVTVKVIGSETPARYRSWVEGNRRKVHEATKGRVGYVHVPDMGPVGYAEFHRGYLAEVDRDALIVDVRYNGGGNVSQLILEKLARRRLGYDLSRWGGLVPYPVESVAGPLVALTNEHAGSDGDIFCHSFKMLKLGPLVGKRTWGGVIGIWPRHALVDGTVTTQPEFSFWFEDVGWNVENYGTDPDIDVDITPQDYRAGRDPQLARAVAEALRLLEQAPRKLPELTAKPSRALPKLPPRHSGA
jgi:tricorn protease